MQVYSHTTAPGQGRITAAEAPARAAVRPRLASSKAACRSGGNGAALTFAEPEPLSEEVKAALEEQGLDFEKSALKYLSNDARLRALEKKATKVEKLKNKKAGETAWTEVGELGRLVRSGEVKWEDLALDDIDVRLKWAGLFHRRKRAPGTFMMRLKVPNGELNVEQLNFFGDTLGRATNGCADITTRANFQLRGITLEEADKVCEGLQAIGLSNVMSGMDNVRNMTGSPIAGIDPHELLDVRPLNNAINAMITGNGKGNPALANLPRKINIGLSPSRDDFPHTHINDVGLKAVKDPETGEVGFNVELGGYFSIKRNTMSIDGDTFVSQDQTVAYCKALLEIFRDHGGRLDRQKARLMWLVEEWGTDKFREMVGAQMGGVTLRKGVHEHFDDVWERRSVLGINAQAQPGLFWVGCCVPAGRLFGQDCYDLARVAEKYGDGTIRLTVEQDIVFPNIPEDRLEEMQKEPLFQKYKIFPGPLTQGLVSCTGAQFCGVAIIETKNRAIEMVAKLEEQLDLPKPVRMHWTGCPNSCAQVQVAALGLMGGPAKLNGKATEGVRLFKGGTIGENPVLASEFEKGIPCAEEILLPKLKEILIAEYGATEKKGAAAPELVAA